ncbi:MAG: PEGA domain-containing protein [Archangium sp.]
MSRHIPSVCVAVAVLSLSAHAQIKAKVVVVPFAAGDGASVTASGKFNALFVEELKTRNDVLEVMPNPATKAAPPPSAPAANANGSKGPNADAVAAMESGKKAFDDLRFEDAVTNLRKGIDGMLQDPATADYEGVTDAYVKLAAAAFRMGEEKDAKNALLDLARFSPSYVMPPGFPPVFQREFEKAKKRLDKQPKGSISIEGPAGATAYVDGRDLGMVPVLEENVPGGQHYIKVEGGKTDRFGQIVQVTNGVVKVKASFGGGPEGSGGPRSVIKQGAGVADPAIAATVDVEMQNRVMAYAKAANAEYALIGYVYKTSDSQLTAGTALFSVRKSQFATLTPVSFDTDVLTANTESFKLADEVSKKLMSFGTAASLPINLAVKQARAGTGSGNTKTDKPTNTDDIELTGPKSGKVVLLPNPKNDGKTGDVVIDDKPPGDDGKPPEVKGGVPVWVWVVAGVAVAGGAAVGGYFGISAATKPVTGTVTATW